jgi:hypothetical protein
LRALRSETCTSFFCIGLKAIRERASEHPKRAVVGVFELKDRFPSVIKRVMVVHGLLLLRRGRSPRAPYR